jgi:HKD family nuclease
MEISFISQPYLAQAGEWLLQILNDLKFTQLRIGVAWSKRSGLSRIEEALVNNQGKFEILTAIVGIDEGGATKQGLKLTLELFKKTYIFHDPSSRTFHPKVYIATGNNYAEILVGSNNATLGGLFSNYEAAFICKLDLNEAKDFELYQSVLNWFETLIADGNVCKPLTQEFLDTLVRNRAYKISNEDNQRISKIQTDEEIPEDSDSVVTHSIVEPIFTKSNKPKKGFPKATRSTVRSNRSKTFKATGTNVEGNNETVIHKWSRNLSKSDAQQTRQNSKPTGNLKLTKAGNEIDHKTFFREILFASQTWSAENTSKGTKEEAIVEFDVTIRGENYGTIALKIDHALYRIANQNNVPTWLHWGSKLGEVLRTTDYSGATVTIGALSNGTYWLSISEPE